MGFRSIGVHVVVAVACGSSLAAAVALSACVGEDVPAATPQVTGDLDGGVDGAASDAGVPTSTDDAGADAARTPSCWGQPFTEIVPVPTPGFTDAIYAPRVSGGIAYFVAASGATQPLLTTPWDASSPSLPSTASPLTLPSSTLTNVTWAPTLLSDGSLVFASGFPVNRQLSLAARSGGAFLAPVAILTSSVDDTDPWFVGAAAAPGALYFARGTPNAASVPSVIVRSAVTFGAGPTFGAPAPIGVTCPSANCGTPVVSPDETRLLFGAWPTADFVPAVYEGVVATEGGARTIQGVTPRVELGSTYPSWISADGCTAIVGGVRAGTSVINAVSLARRTAR